jgi:hypothetical protein
MTREEIFLFRQQFQATAITSLASHPDSRNCFTNILRYRVSCFGTAQGLGSLKKVTVYRTHMLRMPHAQSSIQLNIKICCLVMSGPISCISNFTTGTMHVSLYRIICVSDAIYSPNDLKNVKTCCSLKTTIKM